MVNESSNHTPQICVQDIGDAELPYLLYAGEGPPLLFLHATGFQPWLWHPLARELADGYRILAPSFCDHRVSDPEEGGLNWATLAEDTVRLCKILHIENPFLVGHSMGATVLMIANALHGLPAAGMILIEPILLPAAFYEGSMRVDEHPFAARAIKRTNHWQDREDAMNYLRSRSLFRGWDEEMLELYVRHGMTGRKDGGLQLACTPLQEAALFMGGRQFDPWPLLPKISCPALIVEGEKSENRGIIDLDRIQSLIPGCQRRVVKDAGHLIPMERPREMTRLIREFFLPLKTRGMVSGPSLNGERALPESENRYRELVEMLPQVVFELDLGGYFTFFNRHSLELFGYAAEEMKSLNVFQSIASEDRERAWRNFQKVLRGEPHTDNEYTVLRKDGSRFPVIIFAVGSIRDGRPVGIRGLLIDITERKRAEERLRDLGNRDPLTGLYNRAFFQEELDRLEAGRRFPVSIVMADVDRLKEINDTEGHQAGDDRLRRAAEVLGTFRGEDVVARIGGDEFAVILPSTDADTAEAVLQRVRESLADHNSRHPGKLLGLSFGVATGEKGASLAEVLKRADEAMYLIKTGIRPEGANAGGLQGERTSR
jgi:lipase